MGKKFKDGRSLETVSRDSTAAIRGEVNLEDWDDEELLKGRRKNKNGKFAGGRSPKVLPRVMVHELQRRRFAKAHALLAHSLVDAVEFLRAVVNDESATRSMRLKAAKQILDRVLGKPVEQARISFDMDGEAPWQKVIAQAIVASDSDVVDAEVVEEHGEDR